MLDIRSTSSYIIEIMEITEKQKLIAAPERFGLDLGNNPAARITGYERYGLFPQAVTLKSERGRTGYYTQIHIELLKKIVELTRDLKYPGVRKYVEQNFRSLFALHDVIEIFRVRFLDRKILAAYLDHSGLTDFQCEKILKLYDENADHREVKTAVLNLMSKLKPTRKTKSKFFNRPD